jgi:putative inorganic carbon (HCO3(-)) transporter
MQRRTEVFLSLPVVLPWLAGLEWLAVALAAPFLLFPSVRPLLTAAALLALAALWLIRWVVRREPWPVAPFNGALLLFTLTIPVAIWASALPELTLPKATGIVLGLATFRAVAFAVRDRRALNLALAALCLLGLAIVAVGAMGAQWADKIPVLEILASRIPRLLTSLPDLRADAINPNQLAGALTLYLPLAVALVVGWRVHRGGRAVTLLLFAGCVAFLVLVAGVLLLTQSRGGWMGGAAGLLALGTLWGLLARRRWLRALGVALPLLALAIALGVFLYAGPERVSEALYGIAQEGVETVVGSGTIQGRLEIWSRALYAIQDFPFTGCGLGAFRQVVHILYPLFLISPDTDIAHAHNVFLQAALDLGLPGLVAYLALLGLAWATCWRVARFPSLKPSLSISGEGRGRGARRGWGPALSGAEGVRAAALGLAAGLVGLHVYGLADALALGSKPGVAFWFALGLIAALPRVADWEANQPRPAVEGIYASHVTPPGPRLTPYFLARPWLTAILIVVAIALLSAAIYLAWQALQQTGASPSHPSLRLPIYPAAQGVDVRSEAPPADAGWVGSLEIAAFTTTHSITDVVAFYTGALAEAGWETNIEAGDATSWGGIYTRNEGHSVCLLNVFDIEGEVWTSVVCGDKVEPVDIPSLSPGD